MNLADLQRHIKSLNLQKVYIFYGEEIAVMDIYLNKMCEVVGTKYIALDTALDVVSKVTQKRLSNNRPHIYVVRNDSDLLKEESAWEKLFKAVESSKDYLVLTYATIDKRGKFYKRYSGTHMIEFAKLSPVVLSKYVDKILPGLSEKTKQDFINSCECSYNRILLEADKVIHYARRTKATYQDALDTLLRSGVITAPNEDVTFKFIDAVLCRDIIAGEYLTKLKQNNTPVILVLSLLYTNFRSVLLVQGLGENTKDGAKRTGLTPFQFRQALDKRGYYSIEELTRILELIASVDRQIKTGKIDADLALEYVVINIF